MDDAPRLGNDLSGAAWRSPERIARLITCAPGCSSLTTMTRPRSTPWAVASLTRLQFRPRVDKAPPWISRGGGQPTLPDFRHSSWHTLSWYAWMLAMMDPDHFPGRDLTPTETLWLDAILSGRT